MRPLATWEVCREARPNQRLTQASCRDRKINNKTTLLSWGSSGAVGEGTGEWSSHVQTCFMQDTPIDRKWIFRDTVPDGVAWQRCFLGIALHIHTARDPQTHLYNTRAHAPSARVPTTVRVHLSGGGCRHDAKRRIFFSIADCLSDTFQSASDPSHPLPSTPLHRACSGATPGQAVSSSWSAFRVA